MGYQLDDFKVTAIIMVILLFICMSVMLYVTTSGKEDLIEKVIANHIALSTLYDNVDTIDNEEVLLKIINSNRDIEYYKESYNDLKAFFISASVLETLYDLKPIDIKNKSN